MPDSRPDFVIDFDAAMEFPAIAIPPESGRRGDKEKDSKLGGSMSTQKLSNKQLGRIRAGLQVNHYGPGPHKDGSSQDVHGGGKGGGGTSSESKKSYGQKDKRTLEAAIKHRRGRLKDIETAGRRHSDPNYKKWTKLLEKDVEDYINRFGDLPDWFQT